MMSSGQLRVKAGHSKSASVAIPGEWKFGEGFDTLDLKEAKALLDELSETSRRCGCGANADFDINLYGPLVFDSIAATS